jgi:uncharacterized OB-fold protein
VSEKLDAPFWEAAREGRLVVQRCTRCAHAYWPTIERCGDCDGGAGHGELEWAEVPPVGRVWSYAVYHRVFDPRLEVEAPYVVVAVELDAGVCLPGRFVGDAEALTVGAEVVASFEALEPELIAPVWRMKENP